MARELQIRCLGRLTLHCQEAPDVAARELPLPATLKSQSLFAYLLVHRRRPQGRDHLAELFWGERPERKAHRFLATALWQIRRCLPDDDFILSDTAEVQINPHGALWLDVVEFEKLARVSPHVPPSGDFAGTCGSAWHVPHASHRMRISAFTNSRRSSAAKASAIASRGYGLSRLSQ